MNSRQANILFIPTSIDGYSAEHEDAPSQNNYYQNLIYASLASSIYTSETFELAGKRLAAIARHAYLARNIQAVEQSAKLMLALPISGPLRTLARFYEALCSLRQGNPDNVRRSLECLSEEAPPNYRARCLQVIGLTHQKRGDVDAALASYVAAGRAAARCDLLTLAESQKMIAVTRSIQGDHKQALEDLEELFPLVRTIATFYPATYYDFLNSLAVELGEVGRLREAESALSTALASPFAAAYPEWSETRQELEAKRTTATPSIVAISRVPEVEPSQQIEPQRQRERSRALNLRRPSKAARPASDKVSFQRSVIPFPAKTSAFNAVSILDRVLICNPPRAPTFRN